MYDFNEIQNTTNNTYINKTIDDNDKDDYQKQSYVFMIAFLPLYFVGLFFIVIFYIECIYFPIKKIIINCKYKYMTYCEKKIPTLIDNNGFTEHFIDKLKKNKQPKNGNIYTPITCAICILDITEEEYYSNDSIELDCHHSYHKDCVTQWILYQSLKNNIPNCPQCRTNVINKNNISRVVINVDYDSDSSDTSTRTTLSDY